MKKRLKSPLFVAAMVLAFLLIAVAIFGPLLMPNDPMKTDLAHTLAASSAQYPLGTDDLGRCILSRLVLGCRTTLGTALLVELCVSVIGLVFGVVAGYFGGVIDRIIVTIIDILLSFPSLILALVIAGIMGSGLGNLALAMGLVYWVEAARIARSIVVSKKEETFVVASVSLGSSSFALIWRHILPHTLPSMLVYATLNMASIIIGISSMSYIGLGARPPMAEWGMMLNEARVYMNSNPLALVAIILCIALSVACFQMMGEAMRDGMEPRESQLGLAKQPLWGIFSKRKATAKEGE